MSWDAFYMENGVLLKTHGPDQCAGSFCALHNPSEHPLRNALLRWDSSRNLMMRLCLHGFWHPDPDDLAFKHRATSAYWASVCERHECDGCCGSPTGITLSRKTIEARVGVPWWLKARWALIAFYEWVRSFVSRVTGGS